MGEYPTPKSLLSLLRNKPAGAELSDAGGSQNPFLTSSLLPAEVYMERLDDAKKVLGQQSGIVTLRSGNPVYLLPDLQARSDMLINFMRQPFIGRGGGNLHNAVRDGDAIAIFGGDVAHGLKDDHWNRREGRVVGVKDWELAATMNNELIVFEAVTAYPEHVVWIAGNHDLQEDSPFSTSDKSVAIAEAMQSHPKLGPGFQQEWVGVERLLPGLAVSQDPSVIFTHAAPGPNIALADIEDKTLDAIVKLAGTENIQGKSGAMSEEQMMGNMRSIVDQINGSDTYNFVLHPDWTWMIGHRPTDKEPDYLRVQCNSRLRQVNTKDSQAYAVIMPDRGLYIGDCRDMKKPKKVERQLM